MRKAIMSATLSTALILSTSGAAAAVSTLSDLSTPGMSVASIPISGEEAFRGVMFSEGPAAQLLTQAQPVAPHDDESIEVVDFVVEHIAKEHPNFMDEFGREVQSGQPERTQAVVEKSSVLTMEALVDGEYIDPAALAAGEAAPLCFAIQVLVVIAAAAVYAYAGMLQMQAVATYNWYAENTVTKPRATRADQQAFSLEYENWVANVTSALATE